MASRNAFTFKNINDTCHKNRRRAPKRDPSDEISQSTSKRVKLDFGGFSKAVTTNSEILNRVSELTKDIKASKLNTSAINVVNTSNILEFLCIKYGFTLTSTIISTIKHVPVNFPKRNIYINNILSLIVSDNQDLLNFTDEVLSALDKLDAAHLAIGDTLLWRATEKYSEPHNLFLVPPVDLCLTCNGAIYANRTAPCTVYTLESGPVPALKVMFRCNKCSINYHVDGYSDTNGTYWYTEKPLLRRASKFAYCTEDVFQWICESR